MLAVEDDICIIAALDTPMVSNACLRSSGVTSSRPERRGIIPALLIQLKDGESAGCGGLQCSQFWRGSLIPTGGDEDLAIIAFNKLRHQAQADAPIASSY